MVLLVPWLSVGDIVGQRLGGLIWGTGSYVTTCRSSPRGLTIPRFATSRFLWHALAVAYLSIWCPCEVESLLLGRPDWTMVVRIARSIKPAPAEMWESLVEGLVGMQSGYEWNQNEVSWPYQRGTRHA